MAVRRQFNAGRQSARHVLQEIRRATRITQADKPAQNELVFRVDGHERPDVAHRATNGVLGRDVLLLGANEGPDFVNLHPTSSDVADSGILVADAGFAHAGKQAQDGALRHASQAGCGANGAPFDQRRNDRYPLRRRQFVHIAYLTKPL